MRLSTSKEIFNFDYLVIGAGAVGLASARRLNQLGKRGIIIEKNHDIGLGNSSRNSGVIHAGIYYEKDSLKAKLCLEGRDMLYDFCKKYNVDFHKNGKFIIGTEPASEQRLMDLQKKCSPSWYPNEILQNS